MLRRVFVDYQEGGGGLYLERIAAGGERWERATPYDWDAVTGMGEDPSSCGEDALQVSHEEARKFAEENGINLDAPGTEEPTEEPLSSI